MVLTHLSCALSTINHNFVSVQWADASTPVQHKTRSQSTQTEGLFFKSARALQNETKAEIQARSQRESGRDRRLQLTTYSPGRGFWRQQVDHVCSHLKAYAQNSQDFQKAIGQAQMGKVIKEPRM